MTPAGPEGRVWSRSKRLEHHQRDLDVVVGASAFWPTMSMSAWVNSR
jgi:hypothetical protein